MAAHQDTTKMQPADFLVCQHIIEEFQRPKHRKYVRSFKEPVDIVAVPTYLNFIRQPMDLSTITFKLGKSFYDSATSFKADFELMLNNSDISNAGHPPSPVFEQGRQLREAFNEVWADQHNWLKRVHPQIFSKTQLTEDKENMEEPPAKRLRQSSRLIVTAGSSPTTQSPYTAASVVGKSASNPVTPMPGASKSASKASALLPTKSRADSVSSPVKQSVEVQTTTFEAAEPLVSEAAGTEVSPPELEAAAPQVNARRTRERTRSQAVSRPAKNPFEDFQESLRTMVTAEANAMLEDPNIKQPNEKSNSFANTLWQAIIADDNSTTDEEAGKASFTAWVELAVEEMSKVAIRDVGNQVKGETKKALMVITSRHHRFLRNLLDGCYETVKARLED